MITHRNAYMNVVGTLIHLPMTPADRYLWTLPMFHANGWTYVWIVTAVGAVHVCLPKVDPAQAFQLMTRESITSLSILERRRSRPRCRAVVLLPGAQRGREHRGARRRGARELPKLADEFEIIAVDDGSRRTARAPSPTAWRPSTHRFVWFTTRSTSGYGAAAAQRVRAPRAIDARRVHRRRPPVQGRRSRRVCSSAWPSQTSPTWWLATGSSAPTRSSASPTPAPTDSRCASSIGSGRATSIARASFSSARRSRASGSSRGGAFLSAELLIKLEQRGRTIAEVGVPHYPRTPAQQSGANPRSCSARCAISGGCVCDCGPIARLRDDSRRTGPGRLASRAGAPRMCRGRALTALALGQVDIRAS